MNIHIINQSNINILQTFISNPLPLSFRYFNKYDIEYCLLNHLITIIGTVDDIPVAYGHIDNDNDTKWLGICVLQEHQKKGYGKQIMNHLINFVNDKFPVHLSVDLDNVIAINLYSKFGFNIISSRDKYYIMKRTNNSLINLPVSLGEALDKLTILDIKLNKITDHRKKDVQKEYEMLYGQLKEQIQDHLFYYNLLKDINLSIWDMQDYFRSSENQTLKTTLCMKIIEENDRRFRVKNKINNICKSSIKEQKGYNPSKVFILTHLDLGDHLTALGAVRYTSTVFDQVIVACKKKNLKNIKSFYQDDSTITFYPVNQDEDISLAFGFPLPLFKEVTKDCKLLVCGMHAFKDVSEIPWSFYKDMSISPNVFWDYFYVPNTNQSIILHNYIKDIKYVFIHNICSKGKVFSEPDIKDKLNLDKNDILFINPNENMYDIDHPNFELAQKFIGHILIDYKKIIECAEYNILNESSFFCLSIHLDIKTDHNYYITRYTDVSEQSNSEVFWDKHPYPSTKKRFRRI